MAKVITVLPSQRVQATSYGVQSDEEPRKPGKVPHASSTTMAEQSQFFYVDGGGKIGEQADGSGHKRFRRIAAVCGGETRLLAVFRCFPAS